MLNVPLLSMTKLIHDGLISVLLPKSIHNTPPLPSL
jgi:hypothetical protein